ncbi:MAG: c-type cytochrome, partial [Gammaproteobacteria bacterium]|nr:c-type cytochrome [Gammaproteobacteria bacterium]
PVSRNPIFDTWNVSRVVSGTEGWRCATCHSFAYSGTGILATDTDADNLLLRIEQRRASLGSETELQNQIYLWIKEGSGNVHNYGTSQALLPTILSESELWDLTKFLLEAIQVTVDKIDPQSKTILINTDPDVTGAQLYTGQSINTVNCTTCHGISGQQVAGFDIFQLAVDNPWRFVHKTRFSQTVNSKMPALEGIGDVSVEQIYSLLAYARQQFNTR